MINKTQQKKKKNKRNLTLIIFSNHFSVFLHNNPTRIHKNVYWGRPKQILQGGILQENTEIMRRAI